MITSVTEILDTCDSPEQGGGETELSRLPSSNNIFPLAQELSSSARAAIKNELTNVQKCFFFSHLASFMRAGKKCQCCMSTAAERKSKRDWISYLKHFLAF